VPSVITRRGLLIGGAATAGVGAAGVVGWELTPWSVRWRLRQELGLIPDPFIPDAAEGRVRLEHLTSKHMGDLDLFTAVPAGHGDGAGLPLIVVMHGSSATASVFREIGLARFVTAAVEAGAPPFVLAGTDDGPAGWVPANGVDPQAMVREELPRWLERRGFDADRRALWGWSRGGYGALRYIQSDPGWAAALALFSPALHEDDPVLDDLSALAGLPWGLWSANHDPWHDGAIALSEQAPTPPDPWVQGEGGHTRIYWNDHTLEMMKFLAGHL
jgi:dienelactone hydrolase